MKKCYSCEKQRDGNEIAPGIYVCYKCQCENERIGNQEIDGQNARLGPADNGKPKKHITTYSTNSFGCGLWSEDAGQINGYLDFGIPPKTYKQFCEGKPGAKKRLSARLRREFGSCVNLRKISDGDGSLNQGAYGVNPALGSIAWECRDANI